jgi:ATP-dependent Clp protease ATP-binding subunit ClpC
VKRPPGEIMLFIDELHTVVGAGAADGAIDASNMLKPALARGELQCVGATTLDEYRKHIESDPRWSGASRRCLSTSRGGRRDCDPARAARRYEEHHGVKYSDAAVEAAARLSAAT